MSDFEVVRSDVEGWDVRRVGEAQALSNYATRELAENAAQKQQDAEESSGDSHTVDIRQDVFSEGPEEELDAKKTLLSAGGVLIAVVLLLAVVAVLVAVTGFGG